MSTFRTVVLPVLRLLVWIVIAIALLVLAFGGGRNSTSTLAPEVGDTDSVALVSQGDIRSVIEVSGTVTADPAVVVKSTSTGKVSRVRVNVGDTVDKGQRLFDVVVELPPTGGQTTTNPDGTTSTTPVQNRTRTDAVVATAAGKITRLDVLKDQETAIGTDVAWVEPGTLKVKAPLTQQEQFRLLSPPASAQAQAPGGPAPFECTELKTGAAQDNTSNDNNSNNVDPMTGMAGASPTAEITCTVPAGATVFAGMSANLTIDTGSVTGVLVLPVSAVQGTVGTGKVWLPNPNGQPTEKDVTLGLTDGTMVEITGGLKEGDQVLEFAPVPMDDTPMDPSMMDPGMGEPVPAEETP